MNFACINCGQHNPSQTIEKKEEKIEVEEDVIVIKNDIIHIKEDKADIEENVVDMNDEPFDYDFEMDECILGQDLNLYTDLFSPISMKESEDEENTQPPVAIDQTENPYMMLNKCFNDITEILEYLKGDIIMQ